MNIIDAVQGTQEWHAHRAKHFNASDAPAMMGASKYKTRSAFLREKATGITEDIDPAKQRLFDAGHAAEAAARPVVEGILGDELFPATLTHEVDGLPLSASFDGLTDLGDKAWECKLWNASLADQIRAGDIEAHYYWQLEQQLLVSGAEKVYFTTSDGTPENTVGMWYESLPERRAALIAGWKQFAEDLANYQHTEPAREAVAEPQMALPSVSIQVNGSIALIDNLDVFGEALTAYVERINKNPETDDDFATLEATVKNLKKAEDALDAAENGALAQAASIDTMRRTVAMLRDMARSNRLLIDKLVKSEKDNRRAEIVRTAQMELASYITKLNERIGGKWMPTFNDTRFADAIKGLKSLDSMRDKVAGALANAKIEANEIADRIEFNAKQTIVDGANYNYLVHDFAQVCSKAPEDFAAMMAVRIAAHKEAEAAKIAAAVEAERKAGEARAAAEAERIRKEQEEADKLAQQQAAQQAVNDQRGKADAVVGTVSAQPDVASTQPIRFTHEPQVDAAMIAEFMALLPIAATEKKALREHIVKWEKYRLARELAAAA